MRQLLSARMVGQEDGFYYNGFYNIVLILEDADGNRYKLASALDSKGKPKTQLCQTLMEGKNMVNLSAKVTIERDGTRVLSSARLR